MTPEQKADFRKLSLEGRVAYVVSRLEEASKTLLLLTGSGRPTRLGRDRWASEIVEEAAKATGSARITSLASPREEKIGEMEEAFDWISIIPPGKYVLRRIVGLRSLVNPSTEKHLFSWRHIGAMLGCEHKIVQQWHSNGVEAIAEALLRRHGAEASNQAKAEGCLRGMADLISLLGSVRADQYHEPLGAAALSRLGAAGREEMAGYAKEAIEALRESGAPDVAIFAVRMADPGEPRATLGSAQVSPLQSVLRFVLNGAER